MTVGRNDPCPCGSGKKYKKCCLQQQSQSSSVRPAGSENVTSDPRIVGLFNEGEKLRQQGQYMAALAAFDQAVALDTSFAPAYFNRGMAYFSMKQYDKMRSDFIRAEALAPSYAEMLYKMGVPYIHADDFDHAIRVLEKAITLNPDSAETWLWLARAHYDRVDDRSAYDVLTRAAQRFPDDAVLRTAHLLFISRVQDSKQMIQSERERFMRGMEELELSGLKFSAPERDLHFLPSTLAYHGVNDKALRQRFAALMLKMAPSLDITALHCLPSSQRRSGALRIGFISEGIDVNTTNQFIAGILSSMNADPELEIFLFSKHHPVTADGQRVASQVKNFMVLPDNLVNIRQVIGGCELDVLVYMELANYHMSYCLSFARLAPVQCVWGGFPVTSGVPNVDYFCMAHGFAPQHPEDYFSEKPLMFDRLMTYFIKPKQRSVHKTKSDFGLEEGDVRHYLCPVMLQKMHPDMYDIFARILEQDSKARVVLFASKEPLLRERIEEGIGRKLTPEQQKRLVFVPFAPIEDFLQLLSLVECVLDVPHFSFGTTAFLALAVNAPFVTFDNPMMCGRVGVYMYEKMGLDALVARTHDDYVPIALRLAQDTAWRRELAQVMEEKGQVFFEDRQTGPDFAAALKQLCAAKLNQKVA